ncbi:hypothetical protein NLS50_004440 [Escherichia coli]|nr:hypothetical protein [Escherichia coli]
MSRRRKSSPQAPERNSFHDRSGKVISVNFKRNTTQFRKLWEEEQEIQWDELRLARELQ